MFPSKKGKLQFMYVWLKSICEKPICPEPFLKFLKSYRPVIPAVLAKIFVFLHGILTMILINNWKFLQS